METLNNAHWFLIFLAIFVGHWVGFFTGVNKKTIWEETPLTVIIAIAQLILLIGIIGNLCMALAPNL